MKSDKYIYLIKRSPAFLLQSFRIIVKRKIMCSCSIICSGVSHRLCLEKSKIMKNHLLEGKISCLRSKVSDYLALCCFSFLLLLCLRIFIPHSSVLTFHHLTKKCWFVHLNLGMGLLWATLTNVGIPSESIWIQLKWGHSYIKK